MNTIFLTIGLGLLVCIVACFIFYLIGYVLIRFLFDVKNPEIGESIAVGFVTSAITSGALIIFLMIGTFILEVIA